MTSSLAAPDVALADQGLEPLSVIIPTYNRAHLILRAVVSAMILLLPQDEIIVVDDGSTDRTRELVCEFASRSRIRLRYVRTPNQGAGAARNVGIAEARGPLIAFLDSDDEWMPNKLALQRALMTARPDVLYCFTDFVVRTPDGRERRRFLQCWHDDPRPWEELLGPGRPFSTLAALPDGQADFQVHVGNLYLPQLNRNYVATFTLVARASAGEALHFAADLPTHEDWECFGRLARAGTCAYLDCETAWQYGHAGPRLTNADDYVSASAQLAVVERVWGDDAEFREKHGPEYAQRVQDLHRIRASWLAHHGQMRDARAEFAQAGNVPFRQRLLLSLPGSVVRGVDTVRDWLRHRSRPAAPEANPGPESTHC
jgi:glycosyltransferase involved in cell wall biosynthesis